MPLGSRTSWTPSGSCTDIAAVGGGFQAATAGRGYFLDPFAFGPALLDVEIHVSIGSDDLPNAWVYELSFSQNNQRQPVIKRERVVREGKLILDRPVPEDVADPERLTQTSLEQVNVNQPFRDVTEFFESVRYLHLVPQLVREPDRSVGRLNDPVAGDFEQVARTPRPTQGARLRRIGVANRSTSTPGARVGKGRSRNTASAREVRALAPQGCLANRNRVLRRNVTSVGIAVVGA